MTNNNFIESIKFEKDFLPFKNGDEIKFLGKEEMGKIIEFYLKNKPENSYEGTAKDNADRFKINCVLGNNGGGKSRLFEKILGLEDILNYTSERKNKYWDFHDLGFLHQKTQSYYLKNSNNSLNICDTKKKEILESGIKSIRKLLENKKNLIKKDKNEKKDDFDIIKLSKKSHKEREEKYLYQEKNVVPEEDYLKNIGENSKEIIKFSNILDKAGKIKGFNFILDDFFKLSGNIGYSVNNNLLNEKKYNKFYCNLFNDIGKFKNIYPGFLNIGNDFDTIIDFDFIDWKDNYKGDYFDFLNYNTDYNDETDNRNVKNEIDFGNTLSFFELLAETYKNKNTLLHKFGIKKEESKQIWLYLSELFLLTVNHFDTYLSIDDEFIKEMVNGSKRMGGKQEGFDKEGLFAYKNYSDYKKALNLLKIYLNINLEFLNDKYYLREKEKRKEIKTIIEQIYFNLDILLKNLKNIEDNINSHSEKGYIDNKKQKFAFKDINGEEQIYGKFIDKIQGSKYSSQSKYLLINLLFGYSDIKLYTSGIDRNNYSEEEVEKNKNKIMDLSYYIFDGPIEYFSEKVINANFAYKGKEKLFEYEIQFISNDFVNCNISFNDRKSDIEKSFNNLSAGEKIMLSRFTNIIRYIFENKKQNNFTILIDEPDLHLHLDWQKKYIQKLIDVFSTLNTNIKLHFIIATHSPFIISDLPAESIVILEGSEKNIYEGKYTEIKKYENKSFGANFVDIINDGFFFQDKVLMGSFAETNIENLSSIYKTKILLDDYKINNDNFFKHKDLINILLKSAKIINNDINSFKEYEKIIKLFDVLDDIKNNIGDDFLKENLLYL